MQGREVGTGVKGAEDGVREDCEQLVMHHPLALGGEAGQGGRWWRVLIVQGRLDVPPPGRVGCAGDGGEKASQGEHREGKEQSLAPADGGVSYALAPCRAGGMG